MPFKNLNILREDYDRSNFFLEKFNSSSKIVKLNTSLLESFFYSRLNSVLDLDIKINSKNIVNLHNFIPESFGAVDLNYGINKLTSYFYEMPETFSNEYIRIIREDLRSQLDFDFYFQKVPTLRVMMPHENCKKIFPFFHSDVQLGHPPYEINIWLPLTRPSNSECHGFKICDLKKSMETFKTYNFDVDSIWDKKVEISHDISDSVESVCIKPGEALMFDPRSLHSSIPLIDHTRVSMDIRIVPKDEFISFDRVYFGAGRKKVTYVPGDGYFKKSIDEY